MPTDRTPPEIDIPAAWQASAETILAHCWRKVLVLGATFFVGDVNPVEQFLAMVVGTRKLVDAATGDSVVIAPSHQATNQPLVAAWRYMANISSSRADRMLIPSRGLLFISKEARLRRRSAAWEAPYAAA